MVQENELHIKIVAEEEKPLFKDCHTRLVDPAEFQLVMRAQKNNSGMTLLFVV